MADAAEAQHLYGIEFTDMAAIRDMDAVILTVSHDVFALLSMADVDAFFGEGKRCFSM